MTLSRRDLLRTAAAGLAAAALPSPPRASAAAPRLFRLGLVTYNVAAAWDLPTTLGICTRVGIAALECRTTHAHGVEPTLSADARREVRKRFADSGVTFWGCGSTCEFHSPDPKAVAAQVETCKRFVELVHDLGGTGVKVRPNDLPKGVPHNQTLDQIGKALRACGAAAADMGVEIWVEVHGTGTSHPPRMKTIMEVADHPSVGITWNSNGTDLIDGSIVEPFALLKPWLKSCHINDLSNQYPWPTLFRLLREAGYDRHTLCEYGKTIADPAAGEAFLTDYARRWDELSRG